MADNDIFEKSLPGAFRKAHKVAKTDGSPLDFVNQLPKALASFIRDYGCPGMEDFCDLIAPLCAPGGQSQLFTESCDYDDVMTQSERIMNSYAGSEQFRLAELGARVCQDTALEAKLCGSLHGEPSEIFAQRWCEKVIHSFVLDRLDQSDNVVERFMIAAGGDSKAADNAFFEWKNQVEDILSSGIQGVAKKLVRDPSGQTVTAAAVRLPKRSTAELVRVVVSR